MKVDKKTEKVKKKLYGQENTAGCALPACDKGESPAFDRNAVETFARESPASHEIVNSRVAAPLQAPATSGGAGDGVAGCSQSVPLSISPLVAAYTNMIKMLPDEYGFKWDWFGTWTFTPKWKDPQRQYKGIIPIHEEAAAKAFYRMIHNLNRQSYGVRYTKDKSRGVVYALGREYQRNGQIHYHGLIGGIPDRIRRMDWVDYWWQKGHGIARIFDYLSGHGAEQYLSKNSYCWKRGEIEFGGPLEVARRLQARLSFSVC